MSQPNPGTRPPWSPGGDLFNDSFDHITPDCPVELAGPVEGVPPLLPLRPALPEVADVADEARLDVLVVQELREDHELLPQKLK